MSPASRASSRHQNAPLPSRTGAGLHNDLDVAAEQHEETHEAVEGEPGEPTAHERRDLRLIDVQQRCRGRLRQSSLGDQFRNLASEFRLGEGFCGPGAPEVLEHVATPDHVVLARHGLPPSARSVQLPASFAA